MSYSQADQSAQNEADRKAQAAVTDPIDVGGNPAMRRALEAAEAKHQADVTGHSVGATSFENPGATDYGGGPDMAKWYADKAAQGGQQGAPQAASNSAALGNSLANMEGNRGPQSVENSVLSGRAGATRNDQLGALNLDRQAALGNAPSAAAGQTRQAMNGILGQYAGSTGSARGLSALGGAQTQGAAAGGTMAGDAAMTGGMARSKEIGEAMGMYGSLAGQVRGQDLTRLGTSDQNSQFNAQSNDNWKLGNAGLAAAQGGLGVNQGNTAMGWKQAQMAPADKQFQYDQEMAAEQAGADADKAGASIAASRESRDNARSMVGSGITAGLGLVGSVAGPAGTAAGGMAGSAIANATKKYW